jgi:LuxR family maltose regulon positive regulatory protein
MVEIYNLLAINALKSLDEEAAEKYLENALNLGMKEGYAQSFADELAPMVSLLELYIGRQKKETRLTAYAGKLLIQTRSNAMLFPVASNAIENLLTPAEKKVLQLLLKTCTNQEIADTLNITTRTVKAHTSNIYKKLGVKNRIECMQKAKEISI